LYAESEAYNAQWVPYEAAHWARDGYLWDFSKLLTRKSPNGLMVIRAVKGIHEGVRESLERFAEDYRETVYRLDGGSVVYLALLASGYTEAARSSVGIMTTRWDGCPEFQWIELGS
jgi:hypothetical protein